MTTGFVLSGGVALGAAQVGMVAALAAEGVVPDVVVGSSVGALNGAWLAAGLPLGDLERRWRDLRRRDVVAFDPVTFVLGVTGRRSHLGSPRRLRRLVAGHLPFDRLEESPVPFAVIATDASTGRAVVIDTGPALDALMASAAVPGVFPPVRLGGRTLVDGGVADNTPLAAAFDLGADEVWVLAAGYGCGIDTGGGAVVTAASAALVLLHRRLSFTLAGMDSERRARVRVVPSPCPRGNTPFDFSQAGDLIDRARRETEAWLAGGACPVGR